MNEDEKQKHKQYCADLRARALHIVLEAFKGISYHPDDRQDLIQDGCYEFLKQISNCEKSGAFPNFDLLNQRIRQVMKKRAKRPTHWQLDEKKAANNFYYIQTHEFEINEPFDLFIEKCRANQVPEIEIEILIERYKNGLKIRELAEKNDMSYSKASNLAAQARYTAIDIYKKEYDDKND
jgi:DNA-directed RNA polymerase specialized sigma24 family protein